MGSGNIPTIPKKLGERIVLKGGAATQFYIPITSQRTSIDIDMICIASREELHEAISQIETERMSIDVRNALESVIVCDSTMLSYGIYLSVKSKDSCL